MNKIQLKIKHHCKEYSERFDQITERGAKAGIKKVSPELMSAMIGAGSAVASYMKTAELTDIMHELGGPDHVPEAVEDNVIKALNDLDDQITLEISAL